MALSGYGKSVWATAVVWLAVVTGARAQESLDDLFKDFIFSGCIASIDTGMPVDAYAQGLGLERANANLAAAFLRGRTGSAYIKPTEQTVLIIAEAGDTCTVATRVAPDLPGLIRTVEIGLALLPDAFKLVKEDEKPVLGGGSAATREYDGLIGRRPYGVLLSTTATGSPQATVTVFRKTR